MPARATKIDLVAVSDIHAQKIPGLILRADQDRREWTGLNKNGDGANFMEKRIKENQAM
jgi:hypothetical protein